MPTKITRNTKQRTLITDLLRSSSRFHTVQQIHDKLRADGHSIGLTTIYRSVQALVELGDADVTRLPGGEHMYRGCGVGHHHHLVCRTCGNAVEINAHDVETWAEQIAEKNKYSNITHTVEIFGTCVDCYDAS